MRRIKYDLGTAEHARSVFDGLHERCASAGSTYDDKVLTLSRTQVGLLAALPDDHDGHIDSDGVMWIGGTGYPLAPDQHEGNAREVNDERNVWQPWCSCGFEGERHGTGERANDEAARVEALAELDRHHTRAVDLWLQRASR